MTTALSTWVTGPCSGCGRHKRLHPDGTIWEHLPPVVERNLPEGEYPLPCVGSGLPPAGQQATPPEPPQIVKVPAERITNRGACRICGRSTQLRADGRLAKHLDGYRLLCDGAGRLPARGAA